MGCDSVATERTPKLPTEKITPRMRKDTITNLLTKRTTIIAETKRVSALIAENIDNGKTIRAYSADNYFFPHGVSQENKEAGGDGGADVKNGVLWRSNSSSSSLTHSERPPVGRWIGFIHVGAGREGRIQSGLV